jgi:hypothetical protein
VNGNLQTSGTTANNYADAVVYTLTTPGGETAEWTVTVKLPDDCPQVKKYITYNKPITAYYIEYVDNNGLKNIIAYENKKYSEVQIATDGASIYHIYPDGTYINGEYPGVWYRTDDAFNDDPNSEDAVEYRNGSYRRYEYPLGRFAAWVAPSNNNPGHFAHKEDLYEEVAVSPNYVLPDKKDVTELYVRSEMFLGRMCDVYKDRYALGATPANITYWVDPATGFTLKLEKVDIATGEKDEAYSYEVTKIVIGAPDWDEKHLHPMPGDRYIQ